MPVVEFRTATVPANIAGHKTPIIHDGFAAGMEGLNNTCPSPDMVRQNFGRAYKVHGGPGRGYFASLIHGSMVGESDREHGDIMNRLSHVSDRFNGRVYMGCAGLVNLGYIAAMQPGAAVLFDLNPFQAIFWNAAIEAMAATPKAEDFVKYLQNCSLDIMLRILSSAGAVKLEANHFQHYFRMDRYQDPFRDVQLSKESLYGPEAATGFWAHQGRYAHLHEMAKRGAIGALTLDVTDNEGWIQLADYLGGQPDRHVDPEMNRRAKNVGAIYLSNVFGFLKNTHWSGSLFVEDQTPYAIANINRVSDPQGIAILDSYACPSLQWPHLRGLDRPHCLRDVWGNSMHAQSARIGPKPAI